MVQCCFTSTEYVGLLGTGAQDGHLDFHTAPELFESSAHLPPLDLAGDDNVEHYVLGCRVTY